MAHRTLLLLLLAGLTLASWGPAKEREISRKIKENLKSAGGTQICQMFPVLSPIPSDYTPLLNLIAQFSANVSHIVETTGTPSLTINLIYDQNILYSEGFGLKNLSDPVAGVPNGDTKYRIASNSKMFTTLLALMAQDQGLLEFTEEVSSYVEDFAPINPFPSSKTITFAQLASHMAGLPRNSPCLVFSGDCNISNEEMWARIRNVTLVNPPGTIPEYSNLGFATLGHAVEEIMQSNWSTLVQDLILTPLGMMNTGTLIDNEFLEGSAVGYDANYVVAPLTYLGWEAPTGNMYSSANDLSKFLSFIFRNNVPYMQQPDQILDALSLREWLQPRFINIDLSGFGMPWEIMESPIVYSKVGAIWGYLSMVVFVPQLKFGMVVLQSSEVTSGMIDVTTQFLTSMILPFAQILQAVAPPPYIPPEFNNYIGTYSFSNTIVQITILKTNLSPMMGIVLEIGALGLQFISGNTYKITTQDIPVSCEVLEDAWTEYIYFVNSNPPSFTIPGLYPGDVGTMRNRRRLLFHRRRDNNLAWTTHETETRKYISTNTQ